MAMPVRQVSVGGGAPVDVTTVGESLVDTGPGSSERRSLQGRTGTGLPQRRSFYGDPMTAPRVCEALEKRRCLLQNWPSARGGVPSAATQRPRHTRASA